jgi:hypothetical protein
MQTEYNPAAVDDTAPAIATPLAVPQSAPATPDDQLGEGGYKALKSQREETARLQKQTKQLEAMLAESKKALEQTNLTLEQKYAQEGEQYKNALLTEAQQVIQAEREARQAEAEARQLAEQSLQVTRDQQAAQAIISTFANKISSLLVDPDQDIDYFLTKYGDNFAFTNDGQVVARDFEGNVSPVEDLIQFFQTKHPRMFKAPEKQNTGGGYRNLANATGSLPSRQGSQPLKMSLADIQANPKLYLEHRDDIANGNFTTK